MARCYGAPLPAVAIASGEIAIHLWEQTYDDPDALAEARELCGPRVEAVLDAALGSSGE